MSLAQMTRIFIVGPSDCREEAMRFLQKAGVVHIEPAVEIAVDIQKKLSSEMLEFKRIGQAYDTLKRYKNHGGKIDVSIPEDELVAYTEERLSTLENLQNEIKTLRKRIPELTIWGDFNIYKLKELEIAGVYIQLFQMEKGRWNKIRWADDYYVEVVSDNNDVYFFTIAIDNVVEIPEATTIPWPEMTAMDAVEMLDKMAQEERMLIETLAGLADKGDILKKQMVDYLNQSSYTVHNSILYTESYLFGLQGWMPEDREQDFLKTIESINLPLHVEVRRPLTDETPPSLLKNNWFMQRIEPLLKLYGIPKYMDVDPSYFFAPFMVLFFGICLGDAGYGLVLLLLSLWIDRKWGKKVEGLPLVMKLSQSFAVSTIIIGIITGSIFGYNFVNRRWILIDVAIDVGQPMLFFYIALGLGIVHLSFSYIMGILQSLSLSGKMQKLGLMGVLWGGTLLVARNIWFYQGASSLNQPFLYAGAGLIILGIGMTLLFSSEHKNWGIRIGLGIYSVYGLTGLIGDVLSYARLFGLGIATSAIASVMNQLATMVIHAAGPFIGTFFALIIIIIGHSFNFALSILGGTVHSARLHFVEAFKSFFTGGGVEYKPFKIERNL